MSFITSAQVAYHYNAYDLRSALRLSRSERQMLIAVAVSEEDRSWVKLEEILGTRLSVDEVMSQVDHTSIPSIVPNHLRLPLLPHLAPEVFRQVSEQYKSKFRAMSERQSHGPPPVEVGTLSTADAKAFFRDLE